MEEDITDINGTEKKQNTTKYGEFVCTEHQWLPLDKQKEQAEKLQEITKAKKKHN